MKKLVLLCLAAALLVLAGVSAATPAGAASGRSATDRNADRLPDSWERHFRLSLRVKQTYRDGDRDGLNNLREYRSHTNPRDRDTDDDGLRDGLEARTGHQPRDRDSDDDGIRDGNERAGEVASFDSVSGVLVINLAAGGTATGKVTAATEVKCENETSPTASSSNRGPGGDDRDDGDRDETCPAGALKAGAIVHEAELKFTSAGAIWDEIELL